MPNEALCKRVFVMGILTNDAHTKRFGRWQLGVVRGVAGRLLAARLADADMFFNVTNTLLG